MLVTGHLGAVFRTVLETMRTLFVWALGLVLYYTPLGMGRLGESWTAWSPLQAAGFAALVAGTLVYGRGDDEAARQELAAAVAAGEISEREAAAIAAAVAAGAPLPDAAAAADEEAAHAGGALGGAPAASAPIGVAGGGAARASAPVGILSSSLRASQTMTHGSYSRSLTRHHHAGGFGAGSIPRGSLGAGGLMARGAREQRGVSGESDEE